MELEPAASTRMVRGSSPFTPAIKSNICLHRETGNPLWSSHRDSQFKSKWRYQRLQLNGRKPSFAVRVIKSSSLFSRASALSSIGQNGRLRSVGLGNHTPQCAPNKICHDSSIGRAHGSYPCGFCRFDSDSWHHKSCSSLVPSNPLGIDF